MIGVGYVQRMALYNRWQNGSLYGAAGRLTDDQRKHDRGAFFGSIHKTLNHLLWADRVWMSRFLGTEQPQVTIPESTSLHADWRELKQERVGFDAEIVRWAESLDAAWLDGELTYFSRSSHRDVNGPRWLFVSHFFNHQTHHRGQVHCLLTQAGAKPDDTDLPLLPS